MAFPVWLPVTCVVSACKLRAVSAALLLWQLPPCVTNAGKEIASNIRQPF